MSDENKILEFDLNLDDPEAPTITLTFYRNGREHRITVPLIEYAVIGCTHDCADLVVHDGKVVA